MKKQTYLKSIFRVFLVSLCLMTTGVGEMWGATQSFDGNTYIYWYKWPSAYSTWGDSNFWIQMRNTSNVWTGWQSPQDAEEGWARYLVPEGDYWNIQMKTSYGGDHYSSDGGNVSSTGQTVIWNYGDKWVDYEWHTTYFARSAYVYFDNSNGMLSNDYRYILIGRDGHPSAASQLLTLSKFDYTNIWYYGSLGWNNYEHLYFISNTSAWSDEGQTGYSASSRAGYANKNTSSCAIMMDHSVRQYNLFVPNSSTDETAVTTYSYSGYSSLNATQTLNVAVKPSNSASYSSGTAKGAISMTSYALTAATTCTKQTATLSTSLTTQTISACRTATTTYSVGEVNGNYTFDGFYSTESGSGTRLDSSTPGTYTFTPTSATTVYARFSEKTYNVTAVASPTAGGTVTPSSATAFGRVTGGDITAAYNEGYYFTGWTGGSGSYGNASEANTTFVPTANNTTVTANFDYTWTVKGGFPGETAWAEDHLLTHVAKNASGDDTCYVEITLPANTSFDFKIVARDHNTWWSCSDKSTKKVFTYASDNKVGKTCGDDGDYENMTLTTAGAGTYKFAWNITQRELRITYPVSYKVTYNDNGSTGGSVPTDNDYYASGTTVTVKGNSGSLAKTGYTFGGWNKANDGSGTNYTAGTGTFSINANTTLYAKWTQSVKLHDNNGDAHSGSTTATFNATGPFSVTVPTKTGYRVEAYYAEEGCTHKVLTDDGRIVGYTGYVEDGKWVHSGATTLFTNWTAKNYTISLVNMEADDAGTTSVDVTFDSTTGVKDQIETPSKDHYDFGGYFVRDEETEELTDIQLIDADGNWVKDVEDYTGSDGDDPTWVHDYAISLYAKWTETAYTITPSVSPAGAGSVNTVTDAHLITPSSTITATPANAAWIFDYWECGDQVGIASGSGTNAVTVTAGKNSTITAHFKPRYELVGDIWDGSGNGGMPGWSYDGTGVFTFNSFTALGTGEGKGCDLSCSRTLTANTTYRFQIHDRLTGNHGYATAATYIGDGDHLLFNTKDQNVMLAATGAGTYTFRITNITEGVGDYYPTVTVERPHQVYFGTGYAGIDNLSSVTSGATGGTLAVTTSEGSLSNEDWVDYGTDVTYTPSAKTGYTFEGFYTTDAYASRFTQDNPWVHYNVTGDDHVYAKFEETSTSVTLSNDGNGKVQIDDEDVTSTTCGVTTTRELTAVPDAGYKFKNWTTSSSPDFEVASSTSATTTLTGHGDGTAGTLTANFVERYSIKGTMNGEAWGTTHTLSNIGTNAGSKDTCYVTMTLPANTTYAFAIYDEQTGGWYKASTVAVYNMTYTNHTNWEFGDTKTYNCGITTAGKGTYKFIFNITDTTVTVVYPTSYQVNYGASPSVGGNITVVDDDSQAVPNGGYVRSGGSVTYTAAAASGYTFVGWCNNDSYGNTFTDLNPWANSGVAATSSAYAKFKSTNFVIYRTGDMEDDPRAALDDVESYAGGTISETIEFRMKVRELDKWYSLCLPFTVSAVQVWEDGTYYDLVPFYRPEVGGTLFYSGDYIIRTPRTNPLTISSFTNWDDPTSPTDYLPSKNTPYIIQWHDSYFRDKYVSFFGESGQTIPTSMNQGTKASSDDALNIYGNDAMVSGSVAACYTLDPDYGGGAWLRNEDKSARTVLPFECFIRANDVTTGKYLVIRRDTGTNGATGFETVMPDANTNKVLINGQLFIIRDNKMYNVMGMEVQK